jgi:hypothetical protein
MDARNADWDRMVIFGRHRHRQDARLWPDSSWQAQSCQLFKHEPLRRRFPPNRQRPFDAMLNGPTRQPGGRVRRPSPSPRHPHTSPSTPSKGSKASGTFAWPRPEPAAIIRRFRPPYSFQLLPAGLGLPEFRRPNFPLPPSSTSFFPLPSFYFSMHRVRHRLRETIGGHRALDQRVQITFRNIERAGDDGAERQLEGDHHSTLERIDDPAEAA